MDPPRKLYTYTDLANIALGAPTLTHEHLGVLQSLLLALLNKLSCQDEKVQIGGFEGQCLKKILEKSESPPYNFHNVHTYQEDYDLLEKLEKRVEEFQTKLNKHFEEIQKRCNNESFHPRFWDVYAGPTEDLCTLPSDDNREFCTMARNPTFNREIRRRMTQPIVERLRQFEDQVDSMREKLQHLNKIADKAMPKLKLVAPIIGEIERKRQEIDKHWLTVREAMDETQQMLNCKLERITLPAMRKYLENKFTAVDKHVEVLMEKNSECLPFKIVDVLTEGNCLSCGQCVKLKPTPALDLTFPNERQCNCAAVAGEPTLLDRMDKIKVKTYKLVAIPATSTMTSYYHDQSYASTITQDLRDAGHYVHSYTSYNKYRFQETSELKHLITIANTDRVKSVRRLRSFDPIKSMSAISGHKSASQTLPIIKIKSKLNITKKPLPKSFIKEDTQGKSAKMYDRLKQKSHAGRPLTISSVSFGYMQ